MSQCPQQLFINEIYSDSSPTDDIKLDFPCNRRHRYVTKGERNRTRYENRYGRELSHDDIIKKYIKQHKNSVEDYYNLQRYQTEVVKICKQKLAHHFSPNVLQNLSDEDIVRALKIARKQRSKDKQGNESAEQFVDSIIKAVISNDIHRRQIAEDKRRIKERQRHLLRQNYYNRSYDSCHLHNCTKPNNVINKLIDVFKKCDRAKYLHRYVNDRYFNNPNFIVGHSESKHQRPIFKNSFEYLDGYDITDDRKICKKYLGRICSCHHRFKKIERHLKKQENTITHIKQYLEDYFLKLKKLDSKERVIRTTTYTNSSHLPLKVGRLNTYPVITQSGINSRVNDNRYDYNGIYMPDQYKNTSNTYNGMLYYNYQTASTGGMQQSDEDAPKKTCCCKRKKKKKKKCGRPTGVSYKDNELQEPMYPESPPVPQVPCCCSSEEGKRKSSKKCSSHSLRKRSKSSSSSKKTLPEDVLSINESISEKTSSSEQSQQRKLTRKERRREAKQKKKDAKKEAKREAKREKKRLKKQADKQRPCCIRLIKFICCSSCCC